MHHANLLVGKKEWGLSQIPESEKVEGPDVFVTHYERMSIANVRTLIYEAGLRPVSREYRTFVLICDSLLHEAQNALLKLFEEPNAHTVFYLILLREDMLLPTLRSRLNLVAKEEQSSEKKIFDSFLKCGYADRLTIIGERLKEEDLSWVREIAHGLSLYAHMKKDVVLMRDAMLFESYIHTPGSSKKMLLEHIAISLE